MRELNKVEHRENLSALTIILRTVLTKMKLTLNGKSTSKEAWAAVKTMRTGDEHARAVNTHRLLQEFENEGFKHGGSVDDFDMRLNSIVMELRVLGENIDEACIMKKLLRIVPPTLEQATTSIDMLLGLDRVKVEDFVGWLRVAEGKHGEEAAIVDDSHMKLLLTKAAVGSTPMSARRQGTATRHAITKM